MERYTMFMDYKFNIKIVLVSFFCCGKNHDQNNLADYGFISVYRLHSITEGIKTET